MMMMAVIAKEGVSRDRVSVPMARASILEFVLVHQNRSFWTFSVFSFRPSVVEEV